jgi:predicted phage terminase large subunit-like protein
MPEGQSPLDPAGFLRELQRRDFSAFLEKAWPHISGGEMLEWNWHLDAIGHQLDRIERGHNRRLIVNLPPRNGKSKTISVIWVAWMLGQHPGLAIVCVCYSNELSGKLARDCLSIMQAGWYRALFPRTVISSKRSATFDFETTRGGGRFATSTSGTLTGRGGDIIILDDVIKPEEAFSDVTREKVNDWFRSTLISRLNNKATGAMLCVMQRLHQYDLPGMLLEQGSWELLSLPAIAAHDEVVALTRGRTFVRKAGKVLHAAREPLSVLEELKASMGSSAFQAQYLQDPVPADGNLIKAGWLKEYGADFDPQDGGMVVQSWDTAIKTGDNNDFSVCVTALVRGKLVYVLDVWRGRVEFHDLTRKAIALAQQFRSTALLIEDKASGQQLIQTLRAGNARAVPNPIARMPQQDKFSRVAGVSAMIEAGQLLLPREASWLAEFRSELLTFPNGRFDDQADALAQLLEWVRARLSVVEPMIAGPILFSPDGDDPTWSDADDDHYALLSVDDPWGA